MAPSRDVRLANLAWPSRGSLSSRDALFVRRLRFCSWLARWAVK